MASFDRERAPFWFRQERGASAESLDACERYLGVELPRELRRLLALQDGGVSNYTGFEKAGVYVPVLPFLSADPATSGSTYVTADRLRRESGVPSGVVVFAAEGHAWLGLDYRNGDCPSVVYADDAGQPIEVVASTFDEFLAHLVE